MSFGNRVAALGVGTLFAACAVTSCGNSATPEQKNAGRNILRTTTTAAVSTT
jgi:predicted secreted protein